MADVDVCVCVMEKRKRKSTKNKFKIEIEVKTKGKMKIQSRAKRETIRQMNTEVVSAYTLEHYNGRSTLSGHRFGSDHVHSDDLHWVSKLSGHGFRI